MRVMIINGPNMNLLGLREPEMYGYKTYDDLEAETLRHAGELGVEVEFVQSNHEGDLVDAIQQAYFDFYDGIILNPAGYTHTSVAIGDALAAVPVPCVEVHVSPVDSREEFRRINFVRDKVIATVSGEGIEGYNHALDILVRHVEESEENQ